MQQDHGHVGEGPDQFDGVFRLAGEDLQFEMQAVFFQQCEAAAERRRIAEVGRRVGLPQRMAVPMQLMAHAAQIGELRLLLQFQVEIGIGHVGLADDAVRKAVLVGNRLQPARLVERARHAPHGGDVHRLAHPLRRDVVHPFLHRIVAAQAEIFAVHARDRRIGQPRNVLAQPDVMVGVDHRSDVGGHGSPGYCFSALTTLTTAPVNVLSLVRCDGEGGRKVDDIAERAHEHALLDETRAQARRGCRSAPSRPRRWRPSRARL